MGQARHLDLHPTAPRLEAGSAPDRSELKVARQSPRPHLAKPTTYISPRPGFESLSAGQPGSCTRLAGNTPKANHPPNKKCRTWHPEAIMSSPSPQNAKLEEGRTPSQDDAEQKKRQHWNVGAGGRASNQHCTRQVANSPQTCRCDFFFWVVGRVGLFLYPGSAGLVHFLPKRLWLFRVSWGGHGQP